MGCKDKRAIGECLIKKKKKKLAFFFLSTPSGLPNSSLPLYPIMYSAIS